MSHEMEIFLFKNHYPTSATMTYIWKEITGRRNIYYNQILLLHSLERVIYQSLNDQFIINRGFIFTQNIIHTLS